MCLVREGFILLSARSSPTQTLLNLSELVKTI
jgi:hypothetical protein